MKQNLLVLSYDYDLSKQVAKNLAEVFSMRFFDQRELFEFDHAPRTFAQVCEEYGTNYVRQELRSIVQGELEFDDAVFVADIGLVDNCQDLFYKIKLSNFIVFLNKDIDEEFAEISQKHFENENVAELLKTDQIKLNQREMAVRMELADIEVDVSAKNQTQIVDEIVDKIKNYYSVN